MIEHSSWLRRVFISAFSVRRIIETRQLYPENLGKVKSVSKKQDPEYLGPDVPKYLGPNVSTYSFALTGENCWDVSEVPEKYNINEPVKSDIPSKYLIDRIIHSWIFLPVEWYHVPLSGFVVTSEERYKDLLGISWCEYLNLLNVISLNDAGEMA